MRKAQPFAMERFRPLGPGNQNAVRPAIARMVSLGELERVYRGVFIRPKLSHYVGSVCTTVAEVAKILAKKTWAYLTNSWSRSNLLTNSNVRSIASAMTS